MNWETCNPVPLPLTLRMKLGSIAVHAEELCDELDAGGGSRQTSWDKGAIRGLLADPEVQAFLAGGGALLPSKRTRP